MAGETIRVLHVDDEPDFAGMAAEFLEREDDRFVVETATSADEGLSRLADAAYDYDCVVSDYEMPRTNGIELLERVRADAPDLPFILFTGKGSEAVASDAISAGVTDYLQKRRDPSQYELLANRIRNAVEGVRAERRARRQERQYRELFEQAPFMYVLVGFENGWPLIEDCNDRFLDTLGYDRAEVIGRPSTDFYTEAAREAVYEGGGYDRARRGEFGLEERTLVTAEGDRVDTILQATPRLDENGDTTGLRTLYLDVSDRKERTRRLELAIEYTRSGIWEYDVETGHVTRYEGASDLWGTDAGTTVPMAEAIEGRVHPAHRDDVRAALDATLSDGEPYHVEFRHETPDGYRWAESRGELVCGTDGSRRLVAVTTDVDERKRREEQLRTDRDRLGALFEAAPQPMIEGEVGRGDRYRIVAVNEAFEGTFGYDRTEIVGEDIADALVPADELSDHERFRERVAAGESFSAEVERTTVDGDRTFLLDVVSYGTETTPADGWFATFTDITDRKERQRELEQYETMVETVPDGVYVLDEELEYVAVNQGMCDLFGYTKGELIGSHLSLINDEAGIEAAERNRERLTAGGITDETVTTDDVLTTAEGERIPTEVRFRALPLAEDGSFRGTAGVIRDVTEQRERERELERQNERLEEFASVVSHDLRNPLNVAEGNVELAREECDSEHLDTAAAALDRMEALIEDLLTLAREGGTVDETEPVRLGEVAEACWGTVETGDATLVVAADRTIRADRSRLQQLLANLVGNSVAHGGAGVTVTVGALDEPPGFYVEDDGPGIPPGEREAVFEHGYSTDDDGTGFGLAIVREIAGAHGWDVALTESEAGGARVEIRGVDPGP